VADAPQSSYELIPGSLGATDYVLSKDDVGCYIGFRQVEESYGLAMTFNQDFDGGTDVKPSSGGDNSSIYANAGPTETYSFNSIGPVLPGPPRLLDLAITGTMAVGSRAIAVAQYIGEQSLLHVRPPTRYSQLNQSLRLLCSLKRDCEMLL
jgi:hypothetical protein